MVAREEIESGDLGVLKSLGQNPRETDENLQSPLRSRSSCPLAPLSSTESHADFTANAEGGNEIVGRYLLTALTL